MDPVDLLESPWAITLTVVYVALILVAWFLLARWTGRGHELRLPPRRTSTIASRVVIGCVLTNFALSTLGLNEVLAFHAVGRAVAMVPTIGIPVALVVWTVSERRCRTTAAGVPEA